METNLPIEDVLDDVIGALRDTGTCVLQAPPGAGKTTRVPLALLEAGLHGAGSNGGRIVMLEPRRLAARAAAERMAATLGEAAGETVGYRIRGEAKVSKATRIEVVTEGILTRMLQSEADLPGIGTVIFDEFHERSLNADLGLALTWESRAALREDLNVLVMSATLDAGPVAALLDDAPVVTSDGRAFPVETRWRDTPRQRAARLETDVADTVLRALEETKAEETQGQETEGGVLVFLPGEAEIRRCAAALESRLPKGAVLRPLYGALPFKAQQAAIRPEQGARKIVLATAIAETSLTIQDISVVVDAGLARRARFDPGSGMSRLVTEKVSRAEAAQRRGRAGRVRAGLCYRLWSRAEEGALPAFPPAEIEAADLTGFALELAAWGAEPDDLALLTQPPEGAYAEARALLGLLGALDAQGRITAHGRALAAMPLHPRLAHMLAGCDRDAALLAALLADRDPLPRGAGSDLAARIKALKGRGAGGAHGAHRPALERIRAEAKRLARHCKGPARSLGEMAALAYPDRIGLRRPGGDARYILSGGKGAVIDADDSLAGQRLIVAADLDGDAREARVRRAAPLSEAELRGLYPDRILWENSCHWSRRNRRVEARRRECLGALVLADQIWKDAPAEALGAALIEGIRDLGLGCLDWSKQASFLRARVRYLADQGAAMPDWSDAGLLATLETWLGPYLAGKRSAEDLRGVNLAEALRASLDWDTQQALDRMAPASFTTPLGRALALDYAADVPELSVRLQEMFGVTTHPVVGPNRVPLRIALLSPAQRPVQVTTDLPGFWASSYADVRKDMRGRYPRHHWPEDPTVAEPTLRAKRRGS
ncbi:MAG: ATP-dependent helicase HrpB [Paracoccaceae bacterium]